MRHTTSDVDVHGGAKCFLNKWEPDNAEDGIKILHILHGMAEHGSRYESIAEDLVNDGFIVYCHDHRGHGYTNVLHDGQLGHITLSAIGNCNNGFELMVDDAVELVRAEKVLHEDLPFFLFGHSMGSVIAQRVAQRVGSMIAGLVLSGPPAYPSFGEVVSFGILGRFLGWKNGKTSVSSIVSKLTFGSFNSHFKPNRTDYDWLSRNPDSVDAYVTDPFCGHGISVGFWMDFLKSGLDVVRKAAYHSSLPPTLPILVICGEKDPCHKNKLGMKRLCGVYRNAGHDMTTVHIRIYPHARHEILHDTCFDEVSKDLRSWFWDSKELSSNFQCAVTKSSNRVQPTK